MNVDFPFSFDAKGRTASTDDADHVRDMLEELLFTSPGERVNRPDFGSGLEQLVFAPNSAELAAALQFTLQAAIGRWLGDVVDISNLEVTSDEAKLTVVLSYTLKSTGQTRTEVFTQEAG